MTSTQTSPHRTFQGNFTGSNSLRLFYQSWYPANARPAAQRVAPDVNGATAEVRDAACQRQVKGVLALVHGLGEHSGRYCQIVSGLTAAGYAVYAFDNQGHGKSEGQRGHIDSWQNYRDNIQAFLQLVRHQEPAAPLFLMGHSLGGLIVLDYVLRSERSAQFQDFDICGLVVSAPPIQPNTNGATRAARIAIARLLSGVFPRMTLRMDLDEGGLSRDPVVMAQMAKDPLTHPYVTVRWGTEVLKTIEWVKAHIDRLTLPILLTHGEADPIIAPAGSCEIFQQIESPNKTFHLYPGSYHEPHNDLDADVVVADLVTWLEGVAGTSV